MGRPRESVRIALVCLAGTVALFAVLCTTAHAEVAVWSGYRLARMQPGEFRGVSDAPAEVVPSTGGGAEDAPDVSGTSESEPVVRDNSIEGVPLFDEGAAAGEVTAEADASASPADPPYASVMRPGEPPERANRRWVESRGDYGYLDDLYVGAYNFAREYMEARCAAWGIAWEGEDEFRSNPAKQDAAADAYALERYGGWGNVPWEGGW